MTPLEEHDPTDEQKRLLHALYYEDRIQLEDIADILGSMEAARLHALKQSLENDVPVPDDIDPDELSSDEEFYGGTPDTVSE